MRDILRALEESQRIQEGEQVSCEVFTPPEKVPSTNKPTVFLAGSIEMGVAENWQTKLVGEFVDTEVCFLNPRRASWDKSWKQDISNPKFREQVEWELDHLDSCDHIVVYFDPKTQSPITLMELGRAGTKYPEKVIVACPGGFWRRGNVQILCARDNMVLVETFEDLILSLREVLDK